MAIQAKKQAILQKKAYTADDLVTIVELLRSPGGCPWDIEQTHESIRNDFIEETYEVIEAIDNGDPALLREELGDVLLQIAMHARMEEEMGRCTFEDIANDICQKMIHRHPHVFGDVKVEGTGEVLANWESIKSEEKKRERVTDKLTAIPRQLPALMRAVKVGKKAAVLDFADADAVMEKAREELLEVKEAMTRGKQGEIEEEIGDLLLTVASLARKLGVSAEQALGRATDKFIRRFGAVEDAVLRDGHTMQALSDAELDFYWQKNKKIERNC